MGSESSGGRKHFLDWLRAAAFGALILFHAGMPYVTWDYGIKSERIYPQLETVMIAVGAWRMALLFFIAGVASRFLLDKLGPGSYAVARIRRLLVVVLMAMLLIIPVQVYVEFLRKGWIEPGYIDFWLHSYLSGASFPNRDSADLGSPVVRGVPPLLQPGSGTAVQGVPTARRRSGCRSGVCWFFQESGCAGRMC